MCKQLGADTSEVRSAEGLTGLDGLIFPGGESTTMSKLIDIFSMREALRQFALQGNAVFGTCAGMITLASEVIDSASGQQSLGVMDISVRRNAFGSQLDSFEQRIDFLGSSINVAFIRAPIVTRVGEKIEVLSELEDGTVVAVQQGNILATSFHPEITGEISVHEHFMSMANRS
jgi:pyridoxal 5'-phosphate synthase pdxT subunit